MKEVVWVAVVGLGLYILHRVALWAEAQGYIYYVNTEPSRNALGSAFLQAQSLIEPGKGELAEVIREERSEEVESGAPLDSRDTESDESERLRPEPEIE